MTTEAPTPRLAELAEENNKPHMGWHWRAWDEMTNEQRDLVMKRFADFDPQFTGICEHVDKMTESQLETEALFLTGMLTLVCWSCHEGGLGCLGANSEKDENGEWVITDARADAMVRRRCQVCGTQFPFWDDEEDDEIEGPDIVCMVLMYGNHGLDVLACNACAMPRI